MGWSSNTGFGLFDLEVKAAFLLFPMLLWILPANQALDPSLAWRAFTWANVGSVVICLGAAMWRFIHEVYLREQGLLPEDPAWTNHFFESRFSFFLHPSYMAMYLCASLAMVLLKRTGPQPHPWLDQAVPALLTLGVMLCNSKMGWLTLAAVLALALLGNWQDARLRSRLILLAAIGSALFITLFLSFPTVSGKFVQALSATGAIDPTSDQSSALRRMAWDSALELFRREPLTGSGTGDIKDDLMQQYHEKGYVHAEAKRMNAHSQFLQSAAALGLPGLVLVLILVLLPLFIAFKTGDRSAQVFWIIVLLNWSVESMAEVQAGVVFVAFFGWLQAAGVPVNGSPRPALHQQIPSPA
ncbi:MAG: O-antigen ligase family protein [Flavobacteriales bacterium]